MVYIIRHTLGPVLTLISLAWVQFPRTVHPRVRNITDALVGADKIDAGAVDARVGRAVVHVRLTVAT